MEKASNLGEFMDHIVEWRNKCDEIRREIANTPDMQGRDAGWEGASYVAQVVYEQGKESLYKELEKEYQKR